MKIQSDSSRAKDHTVSQLPIRHNATPAREQGGHNRHIPLARQLELRLLRGNRGRHTSSGQNRSGGGAPKVQNFATCKELAVVGSGRSGY